MAGGHSLSSPLVARFRNSTAKRLLQRFSNGGVQTVLKVTTAPVDPILSPVVTYTRADVLAVVSGVSESMLTSDPNLVVTDLRAIVAAVDYVPSAGDAVSVNGADRRVLRFDAIPAAGDPAIYIIFLR